MVWVRRPIKEVTKLSEPHNQPGDRVRRKKDQSEDDQA